MLEEDKDKMKKHYEKKLLQLEQSKDEVINDLKNNYEAQLKEKESCIKEVCIQFEYYIQFQNFITLISMIFDSYVKKMTSSQESMST